MAFLRARKPILWVEGQTESPANEDAWRELLESMAGEWPKVVVFDNFGFAVWAGDLASSVDSITRLMAYTRRRRVLDARRFGRPTLYYLDIALFPNLLLAVYNQFVASLPELRA